MGSQVVSQPQHNFKMRPSTLCLPLLSLLLVAFNLPSSNSTFAITVAGLSLTAAQVTTLAALGVLAKVGGIGAGLLLARNRSRGARNRSRGKMQSDQEKITLEMLTNIEPDDCYKRVICSASTGKVNNEKMMGVLKLMSEDLTVMRAPISKQALKFVEAARYGELRKNVAKCEHRYKCSLPMEIIQQVF